MLCSRKQFQITEQGDAVSFLSWLLNALHLALGGTKKPSSSIIYKTFRCLHTLHTAIRSGVTNTLFLLCCRGSMRIYTKKILPTEVDDNKKKELLGTGE